MTSESCTTIDIDDLHNTVSASGQGLDPQTTLAILKDARHYRDLSKEQRDLLLSCLDMLNRVNTPDKDLGKFCFNLSRILIPVTTLD